MHICHLDMTVEIEPQIVTQKFQMQFILKRNLGGINTKHIIKLEVIHLTFDFAFSI